MISVEKIIQDIWIISEAGAVLYHRVFDKNVDDNTCSDAGTRKCVVEYERRAKILPGQGELKAVKNEKCMGSMWAEEINMVCNSIGDCGVSINYLEGEGFNELNELITKTKRLKEDSLFRLIKNYKYQEFGETELFGDQLQLF